MLPRYTREEFGSDRHRQLLKVETAAIATPARRSSVRWEFNSPGVVCAETIIVTAESNRSGLFGRRNSTKKMTLLRP